MVLDGVAPPSMRVSLDVWPTRDAALAAVLAACAQSPGVPRRASRPRRDAGRDPRRGLGPTGRDVTFADPRTGATRTLRLTFDHVLAALQPLVYAPELQSLLPEMIARAAAGDFGPLFAAAMLATADLAEQMNSALHYSVTCAEDVPRVTAQATDALAGVRTPRARRARARGLRRLAAGHGVRPMPRRRSPATFRC